MAKKTPAVKPAKPAKKTPAVKVIPAVPSATVGDDGTPAHWSQHIGS